MKLLTILSSRKGFVWSLLALALLPAARGCRWGGETALREESRSADAAKIDGVAISTRNGSILVEGTREERAECVIVRRARASSRQEAEAAVEAIRVEESREGSTWKLVAEFSPDADLDDAGAEFRLRVPSRFAVSLESHNGEISTKGVEGRLSLRTHNGAAKAFGVREATKIRTSNGEIAVQGDPSSLDLTSHNGPIGVRLGSLRGFSKESSIESHNGGIALEVPAGFSAALHAVCNNGEARVDAPGRWEKSGPREWKGTLGTGGPRLRVESHNGQIRIGAAP